jgi:acyl-CoA thioester hydrolase
LSGDWRFSFTDQVRYGDLDTNGHLNNVAYHQFFESARVAYMRDLFPEIEPLARSGEFGMIFAETHVRFASPGFYEEIMRVDVRPVELRRSSVKIAFEMVCEGDGRLVAEGWGTLVGYDYVAGRAAPFPERVAERLRAESGG